MKNVYIFQVVSEICSFIRAKDSKRQADQRPDMNRTVSGTMMVTEVVHLGMAVVTAGNAIVRAGFHDLIVFKLSISPAFVSIARLQESTAAAAAIIVGLVWRHFDDIFCTNH